MNENWQVLQKSLLEKSTALQSTKDMLWLKAHHPYSAAKSKQQSGTGKTCLINGLYCFKKQTAVNIN